MSVPRQGAKAKIQREGRCRTCPATEDLTKHHLVPESWFRRNPEFAGRHSVSNLVPLCRYCHGLVDGTRSDVLRTEKRRALRATLLPSEMRFVRAKRGQPWLDHHYPLATANHDQAA